jgi:hypothetical protein
MGTALEVEHASTSWERPSDMEKSCVALCNAIVGQ